MPRHQKKLCKCACSDPCEPVPPWSETRWEPDTQWCPVVPIRPPLKKVRVPFYTSSEDPAPEWKPNVILQPPVPACVASRDKKHKHGHKPKKGVYCGYYGNGFLRSHWTDNVIGYVYGRNPFSDTVKSGGFHFQ